MDRNLLIAIVLSIAIIIVYQYMYTQYFPNEQAQTPVTSTNNSTKENSQKNDLVNKNLNKPDGNISKSEQKQIKVIQSTTEKTIFIENSVMKVLFSTKGASISLIELKKFKDSSGNLIELRSDNSLPPFVLGTDNSFQLSQVNFSTKAKDFKLKPEEKVEIVFEYSQNDLYIKRTYKISDKEYSIELTDEVNGISSYWITLGKEFGIYEKSSDVHYGPVVLKDAERLEFEIGKVKEPQFFKEGFKWIAQEDKYFFTALVPKGKIEEAKIWDKEGTTLAAIKMPSGTNQYLLYTGPKEFDHLEKVGFGLEHIVDFGFFSFLARPLFWVLKVFYNFTHNYGVAIIILTIIVRIPFIPVINSGQKSMKKMQDLQPKMAEIREKYKNDPQRMQQELMALYKIYKVNPMSGCLPILLQIPVFFALYKVLLIAIELRNAPFVGWITDLSAKDPYYILPIIMGATMIIQQKMTPSAMDPTQQKIMMIMPIVFTFLFLTFPSGLVLYWLVNNVLSIAQQYYINLKIKKESE
ncbi:MAG TPA: membrane protein insertase YidC, partial [Nitrospirae bacterium]|nr:membrane protein insertase YidC [Nitrospirota bacterium]